MAESIRVLIVDDDRDLCEMLAAALSKRGFSAEGVTQSDRALVAVRREDYDVVLTDLRMPGISGIELCERIIGARPDLPVIVMTGYGTLDTAIGAIRAGAYDFMTKPVEVDVLVVALERAARHRRLTREVQRLRKIVGDADRFDELIGTSPAMLELFDLMERVADVEATLLISGESGTGKELVARAIHRRSGHADRPFVAINCAAMPESLLESELFGHARGAFTDAREPRKGLFIRAHGGTLLLDEIGDMPLSLQPKLLRALQEQRVRPVGSDQEVPFQARVISASNRDLKSAVTGGRFREDLYYRLNVIGLHVPPLRERASDVLLLAQHFLQRFAARTRRPVRRLSPAVADKLLAYGWPGNVRELQNCLERAVALARFDEITVDDLPEAVRPYQPAQVVLASDDPIELVSLEEVERRYVTRVMQAVGGNKSTAARILRVDRKTLYRKLARHGIERDDQSPPHSQT